MGHLTPVSTALYFLPKFFSDFFEKLCLWQTLYNQQLLCYIDSMDEDKTLLDKEYLTVEEVADLLRVHWQTVLEYIRSGQLEAGKVGKSYRVTPQATLVFLRERTTGISEATLNERIHALTADKALSGKRGLILSANFLPPTSIENLFETGDGSFAELLRTPPTTRRMGWSFKTSQNDPRPVLGKYLEIKGGDLFRVRLYKDSHLLAYASAQAEYLSWAVNKDAAGNMMEGDNINALAVAELIYNYSSLVIETVKRLKQPPKTIDLHLYIYNPHATQIRNIISQANPVFPLNDYGTAMGEKELMIDMALDYDKTTDTQTLAALLWKEYCHAFGLLDNEIAYLSDNKTTFNTEVFAEALR